MHPKLHFVRISKWNMEHVWTIVASSLTNPPDHFIFSQIIVIYFVSLHSRPYISLILRASRIFRVIKVNIKMDYDARTHDSCVACIFQFSSLTPRRTRYTGHSTFKTMHMPTRYISIWEISRFAYKINAILIPFSPSHPLHPFAPDPPFLARTPSIHIFIYPLFVAHTVAM